MNGWVVAFLIPAAIFAYIGVAALYYLIAVKIFGERRDEDLVNMAVFWPVSLLFLLLWSPIALIIRLTEMIDEEVDNDNKR